MEKLNLDLAGITEKSEIILTISWFLYGLLYYKWYEKTLFLTIQWQDFRKEL